MAVHLITGYQGKEHIQSKDARSFNVAMFGSGEFVMEIGEQFDASIINNNTVRVLDGDILMQGGHIRLDTNTCEDLIIKTGTAGKNRIDLIVMTYEKNNSDGTETAYLEVIRGDEAETSPSDPEYTSGDLASGATKNQMPLYRVKIEGVVLASIEPLFTTIPTYKTLAEEAAEEYKTKLEALQGTDLLDTKEEIEANTQPAKFTGALATKELAEDIRTIRSHVGMIIHSTTLDTEAKVKAIYGGTAWTKIEGRMLLGQSNTYAINSTGGEATTKLQTTHLPSHSHPIVARTVATDTKGEHTHRAFLAHRNYYQGEDGTDSNYAMIYTWNNADSTANDSRFFGCNTNYAGSHSHNVTLPATNTSKTGENTAHNNMPPYKAVYIWERTA